MKIVEFSQYEDWASECYRSKYLVDTLNQPSGLYALDCERAITGQWVSRENSHKGKAYGWLTVD